MDRIKQKHNIFGTAATIGTNDGLKEAFDWLYDSYMEQNRNTNKKLVMTVYSACYLLFIIDFYYYEIKVYFFYNLLINMFFLEFIYY